MDVANSDPSALTFWEKKTLFDHGSIGTPLLGRLNSSAHSSPMHYFEKQYSKLMTDAVTEKPRLAPVRLFTGDTTADDGSAALRHLSVLRRRYSSKCILEVATQTEISSPGTNPPSTTSTTSTSPDAVAQLWFPGASNTGNASKLSSELDPSYTRNASEVPGPDPLRAVLDLVRAYIDDNQRSGEPIDPRLAQALQAAEAISSRIADPSSPPEGLFSRTESPQQLEPGAAHPNDSGSLQAATTAASSLPGASAGQSGLAGPVDDGAACDLPTPFQTSNCAWAAARATGDMSGCTKLQQEAQGLREQLRQRALAQYENNRLAASAMHRSLVKLHQAAKAADGRPEPLMTGSEELLSRASRSGRPSAPVLSLGADCAQAPGPSADASAEASDSCAAAGSAGIAPAVAPADPVAALAVVSRQRDQLVIQCARLQRQCSSLLSYVAMLSGNDAAAGLLAGSGLHVGLPARDCAAAAGLSPSQATAHGGSAGSPAKALAERLVVRMVVLPDTSSHWAAWAAGETSGPVVDALADAGAATSSSRSNNRGSSRCSRDLPAESDRETEEAEEEEEEEEEEEDWPACGEELTPCPVRVRLQLRVVRVDVRAGPRVALPLGVWGPSERLREEREQGDVAQHFRQALMPETRPLHERLLGIREEDDEADEGVDAAAACPHPLGLADRSVPHPSTGGASSTAWPQTGSAGCGVADLPADTASAPVDGAVETQQQLQQDRRPRLSSELRHWSAPTPVLCSTRESCQEDAYLHFTAAAPYDLGGLADAATPDAVAAVCAAAAAVCVDAADDRGCHVGGPAGVRISATHHARLPTPPCSPRTSPCSPTGSHDPTSSLMDSCSAAAAGGQVGPFEEGYDGYYSEEYDLADSEWDELAAAATANGPGALLSAVAFLREQLQLAQMEIVSLTTQLGNLSHQREGLRARACQHDAALQQLAINEGEALLEVNRLRAQLASERAARARLSAQCEDLQNRLLHGFPDRPHLSMQHHHLSHGHSHGHHSSLPQYQSAGHLPVVGSPGSRRALGAGLHSGPVGLGAAAAGMPLYVPGGTRGSSGGGGIGAGLVTLQAHNSAASGANGISGPHHRPCHAPHPPRPAPLLPSRPSQQQPHLLLPMQPRHRSAPRYRAAGTALANSADWTAAITAIGVELQRAGGSDGDSRAEVVQQESR